MAHSPMTNTDTRYKIRRMESCDLAAVATVHAQSFSRQLNSEEWILCNFKAYPRIRIFVKDSHQFRPNRKNELAAGAEIAFVVDDVEKQFNRAIDCGATEVLKPSKKPWRQTVAYVHDNNGFIVEICNPITG